MNLRQLLKEYLELNEKTIEEFIAQFEAEWQALLHQVLPDEKAAELTEKLLGIPDWTKNRP